jgi:hypothetical protein
MLSIINRTIRLTIFMLRSLSWPSPLFRLASFAEPDNHFRFIDSQHLPARWQPLFQPDTMPALLFIFDHAYGAVALEHSLIPPLAERACCAAVVRRAKGVTHSSDEEQ